MTKYPYIIKNISNVLFFTIVLFAFLISLVGFSSPNSHHDRYVHIDENNDTLKLAFWRE